jgi:hypothetical protein
LKAEPVDTDRYHCGECDATFTDGYRRLVEDLGKVEA